MADYFTSDHFKLLNKWKGQKRDESSPEQNRAYEELKRAYEVTEAWATGVKTKLFPKGVVKVRKRPTSQANSFLPYNWARIYPAANSPKELAYTVGIGDDNVFVVKVDTVGLDEGNPIRRDYLALRGGYDNKSPIVAMLPASEGLGKSLTELVEWSVKAIRNFRLRYDEVVAKLRLAEELSDEDLLKHFDGKPAFKTFRASWSPEDKATFCRLAKAVHAAGLDWWHMGKGIQVRFGRKSPGSERAIGVLGIVRGKGIRKISWHRDVGPVVEMHRVPLTEELVEQIKDALASERESLERWLVLETERPGLWPDELLDDPTESDEDSDDEELPMDTPVTQAFNRIYYGPPGTGKTYELCELLGADYKDPINSIPIEEWRKQFIAEQIGDLKWWEGAALALHQLGGKAKVAQLREHPFIKAIVATNTGNKSPTQTLWGALQYHTQSGSQTVKTKKGVAPAIFDKLTDSNWQLIEGWKDECADLLDILDRLEKGPDQKEQLKRYEFVTFHQSYGYEEFVEGLRPVLQADGASEENDASGDVKYRVASGAFKKLCARARLYPNKRFAMVIDEINRGNISKIFGELITLVEIDKREGAKYPVTVTLPYSGESFSVPSNVDVIGTMNTADRSLALVDTALRRRFEFVESMPKPSVLAGVIVSHGGVDINLEQMLTMLNKRVEALYDRDHTIGHAYFTGIKDLPETERFDELKTIFKNKIIPLLEEYFFEDWQKIRLVLGDNQKTKNTELQFVHEIGREEDLLALFGRDNELDQYALRSRYQLNPDALALPEAYVGIYAANTVANAE
ncbi:McrB family protein [Uliginosibacterium sp. TH139]|uniref:McrB family protein n=1 Tax=Uliginosibacterium sp. TH139 TaxID=2067453 RepID=UPI000C7B3EF6|nr:AAA family ATPase [Uliginosibacterium sp. TH139]PLK49339.1 restriction endonuclease [Uliginosibacterium sp. TH139]